MLTHQDQKPTNGIVLKSKSVDGREVFFCPSDVRAVFRRKFQHEYILPSGKPSGIYAYPMPDEEVLAYTTEFSAPTFVSTDDPSVLFGGYMKNESEWRLWTALRLKYGTNYMNPKKKQFWLPDSVYGAAAAAGEQTTTADTGLDLIGEFGAWVDDIDRRTTKMEKRVKALTDKAKPKPEKNENISKNNLTLPEINL